MSDDIKDIKDIEDLGIDNMPLVMHLEKDERVPANLPMKVQQILCLKACGFSSASIASLADMTRQGVNKMLRQYDPDHQLVLSETDRKRFLAGLWEARAGEALLNITPAKLKRANAVELARVAALATKSMAVLAPKDSKSQEKDPYALLDALCL